MRVISLVPSWTETLIESDVNVVGRTRYCIHPADHVTNIATVGGTKNWNWKKIVELKPDLILLDQEENPKSMAEQTMFPWHATHVTHMNDMSASLNQLSEILASKKLKNLSSRWDKVLKKKPLACSTLKKIPGVIEWGIKPAQPIKQVLYIIWKDPWMAVSKDTFIGSVLAYLGIEIPEFATKYPQINLENFNPKETLLLFSSEPYPFLQKKNELAALSFPHAFVDGECFSWFGCRTLRFLESHL